MDQHSCRSFARTRHTRLGTVVAAVVFAVLAASACAGSTDVEDTASAVPEPDASQPSDTQPSDTQPSDTQPSDTQPSDTQPSDTASQDDESGEADNQPSTSVASGPPGTSSGTFELVLENGESFTAPVICSLEPQIAAGSEILFSVVGPHEGRLYDVTQWGETSFGGTQSVEVVDLASFDGIWRATGSTGLELELNGNVISGSGGFYPGEELNGPQTQGEVTVTC